MIFRSQKWLVLLAALTVLVMVGIGSWWARRAGTADIRPTPVAGTAFRATVDEQQLELLCSHCHLRPPPDALPREWWPKTVWMMSRFGGFGANVRGKVDVGAVADWYRQRAPEKLSLTPVRTGQGPGSLRTQQRPLAAAGSSAASFVSHLRLCNLRGDAAPELLVCEMRSGVVLLGNPAAGPGRLEPIARVEHPAHAEPVDLDQDGRWDVVVANLGSFLAMDHKLGTVEWLRQTQAGAFEKTTLARGLGRTADVQPGDLDADGDVDLVVAEFGWRGTGRLLVLENRSKPQQPPAFHARAIDGLHGCSHVAVRDLNGDGAVDILALYSQEHEQVRCYWNRGKLAFEAVDLYRAPHPVWGTSGFQVVDLDADGDLDMVVTNGESYDTGLVKPYHGVVWLENRGEAQFEPHTLVQMYGVYRAETGDLDGDGDLDIVACALAEAENPDDQRMLDGFESLLWLEQTAPGRFLHRTLESGGCHHPTLTLGDVDLDGDVDLLVGNGQYDDTRSQPDVGCVNLWENLLR